MSTPTHAQVFTDAVWNAEDLTAHQKIVALCYADHARKADRASVVYSRLRKLTGIGSNATLEKAIKHLVESGWLENVGSVVGHSQRVMYRLIIPTVTHAVSVSSPETATDAVVVNAVNRDTSSPKPRHMLSPTL